MLYGRRPGFTENAPMGGMPGMEGGAGHAHGGKAKRDTASGLHISDSSTCQNFGTVKRGDRMQIEVSPSSTVFGLSLLTVFTGLVRLEQVPAHEPQRQEGEAHGYHACLRCHLSGFRAGRNWLPKGRALMPVLVYINLSDVSSSIHQLRPWINP